jgi:hypothetical protein
VHVRRALILFALVLGLTALAASIAPAPDRGDPSPRTQPPPASATPVEETTIGLEAPAPEGKPPSRRVGPGAPLVLVVKVRQPGEVLIPRLGRTTNAAPNTSVRFDLLGPDPGRYDILFTPTNGEPERVGTLVSRSNR